MRPAYADAYDPRICQYVRTDVRTYGRGTEPLTYQTESSSLSNSYVAYPEKESDVNNAREHVAFRNALQTMLTIDELRAINWRAVMNESDNAIDRGWTGEELARWCATDLSGAPDSPGAVIVTRLRNLGETNPPREHTPQPIPMSAIHADRAHAIAARSSTQSEWAARVRAIAKDAPKPPERSHRA